ncbi:MAG: hypothetical protein V3S51_01595 [Dehalococcoidia bacterium]
MPEIGEASKRPTLPRKPFPGFGSTACRVKGRITWGGLLAPVTTVAVVAVVLVFAAALLPGRGEQLSAAGSMAAVRDIGDRSYVAGSLVPTNQWVNFYGLESTFGKQPLPVGVLITVRDPQGVVCGEFSVTQAGRYGLIPVYGDDPLTEVDEGAVPGDLLEFRVDGVRAKVTGPDRPVWTAMGDLKQVNLAMPKGLADRTGGGSR